MTLLWLCLPGLSCPGWHLRRCHFCRSPWAVHIAAGTSVRLGGVRQHRGGELAPLRVPCTLSIPNPSCSFPSARLPQGHFGLLFRGVPRSVFSRFFLPPRACSCGRGVVLALWRWLSVGFSSAGAPEGRQDAVPTAGGRGALRDGTARPAHQGEGQAAHAQPTHEQGGCHLFPDPSAPTDSPADFVPFSELPAGLAHSPDRVVEAGSTSSSVRAPQGSPCLGFPLLLPACAPPWVLSPPVSPAAPVHRKGCCHCLSTGWLWG